MPRDEHGMPLPVCGKVIVDQFGDEYHLISDGEDGFQVVLTFCKTRDAAEFLAQAINYIALCREIVRELAGFAGPGFINEANINDLINDAAKLWAKMQEEAKGGSDD